MGRGGGVGGGGDRVRDDDDGVTYRVRDDGDDDRSISHEQVNQSTTNESISWAAIHSRLVM